MASLTLCASTGSSGYRDVGALRPVASMLIVSTNRPLPVDALLPTNATPGVGYGNAGRTSAVNSPASHTARSASVWNGNWSIGSASRLQAVAASACVGASGTLGNAPVGQ